MNIYTIYRATNTITGKVYIGFTSRKLKTRISSHKHRCFTDECKNKFYDAIRSYGWDKFVWDEIYLAKESVKANQSHTLTVMEDFFIGEYDSLTNGYNTSSGGGLFPDTKGANNPMFNKKHSEKSKELIRKNTIGKRSGANNGMYGVTRTKEWLIENQNGDKHPMWGKKHNPASLDSIRGPDIECKHCGKISNRANFYRWHGDKCKHLYSD